MSWELIIDDVLRKRLKRIPTDDSKRIFAIMQGMVFNPYAGDIEKMKGEKDVWRRRIGSYRVFYEIYKKRKIIYVFNVQRRTSSTY